MTTRALQPDEISLLEQTLLDRGKLRDRLFLVLAATTGFRVGELLALRWRQLLDATGQVVTHLNIERRKPKGGQGRRRRPARSRRVPLTPRASAAISDWLGAQSAAPLPHHVVFRSRIGTNQPIQRRHLHRLLKRLAKAQDMDATRVGCHSARKTFATAVHQAGGRDLVVTQRIMGHASPLTTARYLETSQDYLDSVMLALDANVTLPAIQTN